MLASAVSAPCGPDGAAVDAAENMTRARATPRHGRGTRGSGAAFPALPYRLASSTRPALRPGPRYWHHNTAACLLTKEAWPSYHHSPPARPGAPEKAAGARAQPATRKGPVPLRVGSGRLEHQDGDGHGRQVHRQLVVHDLEPGARLPVGGRRVVDGVACVAVVRLRGGGPVPITAPSTNKRFGSVEHTRSQPTWRINTG